MTHRPDDMVAAYRRHRGPDPAAVARIRERLEQLDQAPTPVARRFGSQGGLAAGAALLAAAALLWWWSGDLRTPQADRSEAPSMAADQLERGDDQSARPVTVDPDATAGVPAPVPPVVDAPTPPVTGVADSTPAQPRPDARRPRAQPSVAGPSLQEETARVATARAALNAGDPKSAVQIIKRYREDFPRARLAEEADAVVTMARCRQGLAKGDAAAAFARTYPRSLFFDGVDAACKKTAAP